MTSPEQFAPRSCITISKRAPPRSISTWTQSPRHMWLQRPASCSSNHKHVGSQPLIAEASQGDCGCGRGFRVHISQIRPVFRDVSFIAMTSGGSCARIQICFASDFQGKPTCQVIERVLQKLSGSRQDDGPSCVSLGVANRMAGQGNTTTNGLQIPREVLG